MLLEEALKDVDVVEKHVRDKCQEIADLLADKNRKYGNAALNPKRIFSKADPEEQIRVRMDDKITRLQSNQLDDEEDPLKDLMGYIVLTLVLKDMKKIYSDEKEDQDPVKENPAKTIKNDYTYKACGAWGGCVLPEGHNQGKADIPSNHAVPTIKHFDQVQIWEEIN